MGMWRHGPSGGSARLWRRALAGTGTIALVIGVITLPSDPRLFMLAPTFACLVTAGLMASWPRCRGRLAPASAVVGGVSLAVTAVTATMAESGGAGPTAPTSLWLLLEPTVLLIFVYLPVRWSPRHHAVWGGGLAALAEALNVQRYIQGTPMGERIAASAMWMVFAVATGAIAWYLRSLAESRGRAIAEARQNQRLELAADLHDFVAHDVSEIVAQAQAGRIVLAPSDPRLAEVLERIETAGLRALTSMDRTVHMLRETDGATVAAPGVLADLGELLARFESAGTAARLDDRFDGEAPREIAAVAYRVVVEALTNVRRHAATATRVAVRLEQVDDLLVVTVTDDGRGGGSAPGDRASAGTGLAGLSERVAALGGELTTAPERPHGWRVTARLPLTQGA